MIKTTCMTDSNERCGILGVSQVVAQIMNASVVVHGPKGCVFPAFEASIFHPVNYNFTELCEKSTIFGGEDAVKDKIIDEFHENNPSLIALVTTCSSEITGDDVEGIIHSLGLPIPVIKIDGSGFTMNQLQGANHAFKRVVEELAELSDRCPGNYVNLIPHVGSYRNWQSDIVHLEKLLKEAGLEVRTLVMDTSVETIKRSYDAMLNILVSKDYGLDVAVHMEKVANIPFVCPPAPIGLEGTSKWLEAVGVALNSDFGPLADAKVALAKGKYEDGVGRVDDFRPFESIRKMTTMIIGSAEVACGFAQIFHNELSITPDQVIIKGSAVTSSLPPDGIPCKNEVIYTDDFSRIKESIRTARPTILMGNDLEYYYARTQGDPIYINISYPGSREIQFYQNPYFGFDGVLHFIQELYNKIIQRL